MGETKIGRFLGPSHRVRSITSYRILPSSGIPVSRTTVQRITYLETYTYANKSRFKVFGDAIQERFNEKYDEATFSGENSSNPTIETWAKLAENYKDFKDEFNKLFNNQDIKEADDDFTAD